MRPKGRRACLGCLGAFVLLLLVIWAGRDGPLRPWCYTYGWGGGPFNSEKWQDAGRAKSGLSPRARQEMTRSLLLRGGLMGMTREQVGALLGPPDRVNHFIGQGRGRRASGELDFDLGYNMQLSTDDILALYLRPDGLVDDWAVGSG